MYTTLGWYDYLLSPVLVGAQVPLAARHPVWRSVYWCWAASTSPAGDTESTPTSDHRRHQTVEQENTHVTRHAGHRNDKQRKSVTSLPK